MCSDSKRFAFSGRRASRAALAPLLLAFLLSAPAARATPASDGAAPPLRVCADPNNLPFSNEREEGFENAIAKILAEELGRSLEYAWQPQRRGFIRNTLRAQRCDLVIGVPADYEMAQTTQPYYRSSYVFVTRTKDKLHIDSLDDPALKQLRIGLHVIGDDYSNVPPAQALALRGIIENVRGYSIYGDYSKPDPPRDLIDAVANEEVDVAIAWGPLAGYFAQRAKAPLTVTPLPASADRMLPMAFDIAMGVRRGEDEFKALIEQALARRHVEIQSTLRAFGVPFRPQPPRAAHRRATR
jgi:mxaJ protein